MSFLGLGKALTRSSWQPFLQPLQARGQQVPSCTGLWGVPGRVSSWQDQVMGLVAVPPQEEAAGWMSVTLPGRGSRREMSGVFSSLLRGARAEMGRLLTSGTTPVPWRAPPPCPEVPSFAPSVRTWGEQRGPMPESTGSLCPCVSPHLGFLERSEVRGRALESSPRARLRDLETRVPWQW